jgi:hypothetical protein
MNIPLNLGYPSFTELLVYFLGAAGLSALLSSETLGGPGGVLIALRKIPGVGCMFCNLVWIGAMVSLGHLMFPVITFYILLVFAVWAAAVTAIHYGGLAT